MPNPISPPAVTGSGRAELPAYLSNGVVGLRVRDNPLAAGMTLLSGYSGEHAERQIEAAAVAPYPLAGDIALDGVWMSDVPHQVQIVSQAYDFACGELTTHLVLGAEGREARLEILTFCDRQDPTLVCQELVIELDQATQVRVRGLVDSRGIEGRALRFARETPGEARPACDGSILWESAGGMSTCGVAYVTELVGEENPSTKRDPLRNGVLGTELAFGARGGRRYRLRQMASIVPSVLHRQPDHQATRLVARARADGFDKVRAGNRAVWKELWKGRIQLVGADHHWQAMADAAFFYLNSSVHQSSPASTSIFGLATWHDYHYYYGHVMWDVETFAVPPLLLLQPEAAANILDYRYQNLGAARNNAKMRGRNGLQFPWESAPSSSEEASPLPGTGAWHEDHVSLDVARAFALYGYATDNAEFVRERGWPVLSGVADWIVSRVVKGRRGYEIRASMGIAERKQPSDNAVFTNMSASVVLKDALTAAERLGRTPNPAWAEIADKIVLPMRGNLLVSHDGYRSNEEKGGTPDPLMGIFPLPYGLDPGVEKATLDFYLPLADDYIGSPMLSALYGVWAARAGDRALSLKLLEEGYGKFCAARFLQTLEYRADRFPEQPRAGPFFANLAGFLSGLLLGFPNITPGAGDPQAWIKGPCVLPRGWQAIEVERVWVRGQAASLTARHGSYSVLAPE